MDRYDILDIHGSQRTNPNDFGDVSTPVGQCFHLFSETSLYLPDGLA